MSSSPYASKELKSIEKKQGKKYPTMKSAKEPGLGSRIASKVKRAAKSLRSPYSKTVK